MSVIAKHQPIDYQGFAILKVALADADTAGGIAAVANPAGEAAIIHRLLIDVETESTGACTVDAGVAADAETSSDTLIDGASVAAAALLNNSNNAGTNGKAVVAWAADKFVTISMATGAAADLAGNAYIVYSLA
jgi:hypothetical protein